MATDALAQRSIPGSQQRVTYQELAANVPESNQPCELWDGEIVMSPAPSFYHQEITFRFHRALYDWVTAHQLGKVVAAPVDMVLSPHRSTQPDVAFVSQERLKIVDRAIMGPADLVAEVVSLEGRTRDRIEKRDLYEQHGVKEYWIIDPEPETVDVLVLEGATYRVAVRARRGETAESRLLPGFQLSAEFLFHGP
ncbi:MAG: Uma2 family endonuclease [Verrucomicrobiia bacterium]